MQSSPKYPSQLYTHLHWWSKWKKQRERSRPNTFCPLKTSSHWTKCLIHTLQYMQISTLELICLPKLIHQVWARRVVAARGQTFVFTRRTRVCAKKSIKKAINESQDHLAGISAFVPLMNGSLIELLIDAAAVAARWQKQRAARSEKPWGRQHIHIIMPRMAMRAAEWQKL